MNDPIIELVISDLCRRSQVGINKYGVTLDRKDLSLKDWLQHAYEECLDQANYLKRAIIELENKFCLDKHVTPVDPDELKKLYHPNGPMNY